MSVTTLSELFLKAASYNKPQCLLYKVGGKYQPVSTAELVDRVRRLAKALEELGVQPGDRVALMAENGPHWPTVDFAGLCIGAVVVPIYPTLLPDQSSYIARNCGAKVVVAETTNHLEGFLAHAHDLPDVQQFVLVKGESADPRVVSLDSLLARGAGADPARFEEKARAVKPDDLATFIYTSGTTGTPKGVMLTHRNIASNVVSALDVVKIEGKYTA
ncbi:MAG TPA: AMP-binding protein, partial [Thermoanaerobaculia bacterium]